MFVQLFTIIAPVLICAAIGYVWRKQGRPFDVALVTALVTNVGTPCLVFASLVKVQIEPGAFAEMAGAAFVTIVAFGLVSAPALKLAGLSQRAFLPSMMFGNTGNMGLPLSLFAFGEAGLALAITYFAVFVVAMFTFGVAIAAGSASPRRLAKLPFLYAVAAALVFMFTDLDVPAWLFNTVELLGGLTIPLMLITLGVSLAGLGVGSFGRSVMLSLLRIGIGFLVGWGVAEVLDLEGAARGVLILQSAMPVAVYNYLFAERFQTRPGEVAGIVVVSTVLSFATLPALLWFVL